MGLYILVFLLKSFCGVVRYTGVGILAKKNYF